ncbi:hypothetical protein [Nocardia sp. NPDC049526]|uniref:hypothetical protein n=1 Tax=Nocardia sp. NPDC049526 TaxID=3364316 RepID=UPI0037B15EB7
MDDLISDLDVVLESLRRASTLQEERIALSGVLDHLYKLRCLRESDSSYRDRVRADRGGKVAEAISLIRGDMTHDVTKEIEPKSKMLHPGEDLFPSEDLFPGKQLIWLYACEMVDQLHQDLRSRGENQYSRYEYYGRYVAGQPVLQTVVAARDFLVNDAGS